jgi:hypothetical protein
MIDLSAETVIPLGDVSLPGRAGKRIHFSTVWRWVTYGVRGPDGSRVRLDALRVGGKWVTSEVAIQRFAEALTPRPNDAPPIPTVGQQQRAAEAAGRKLEALGI